MKLVTKLKLFGLFAAVLLILLGGVIFWRYSQIDGALEKNKTASSIVKDAFLLTLLNDEYRQTRGERATIQWKSQHKKFSQNISSYKVDDNEEQQVVDALSLGQMEILNHFDQLQKNIKDQELITQSNSSSSELAVLQEAEIRLTGQLGIDMQKIISQANELEKINSARLLTIRQATLSFIVVVITILGTSLLLTYFLFAESISRSIRTLTEGTKVLSQGNLDFRLNIKSQDEFGQLGQSFDEMVVKLKELDYDKTEFVTLASHQLRTPLTIVNWYSEALLSESKGNLNATQKEYLEGLYSGCKRMVKLTNDLLNISRMQLGKFKNTLELVRLEEIIRESVLEFEELIAKRKITLIQEIESDLPEIKVDTKALTLILANLLSNSILYTPENGTVKVGVKKQQNEILITIADSGIGIPLEQQPKIFTKFFRADNVKEFNVDGAGLGLYMTKMTADNLGCKIWFVSEIGRGSSFYLSIPQDGMQAK